MSRRLTPEEERLWRLAMRGTSPLAHTQSRLSTRADQEPLKKPSHPENTKGVAPGSKTRQTAPPKSIAPKPPPDLANLDRRSAQRVRRGKIEVEGRIDLHGMSQAEAHDALIRYLLSASAHGSRVVLVITGKGRKGRAGHFWEEGPRDFFDGRGEGILKAQVPLWLRQSPLRERIFSVQEAHPRHGGSGALYVFLKKS
ncbi:MAG: DNA mismatch repair protein MutS [Alphaproteobacteria bacterium]|nr:MAG: DNA mismatch repair protein MutS [Alphaproteobacteria bacterium]